MLWPIIRAFLWKRLDGSNLEDAEMMQVEGLSRGFGEESKSLSPPTVPPANRT